MFTARGSANVLSRTTAFLAMAFFATSLLLTVLANQGNRHDHNLVSQIPALVKPVDGAVPSPVPNAAPVVPMNSGAPVVAPVIAPAVNSIAAPVIAPVNPEILKPTAMPAPVESVPAPAIPSVPLSK
jgi:preprotein translocase subunit SecG